MYSRTHARTHAHAHTHTHTEIQKYRNTRKRRHSREVNDKLSKLSEQSGNIIVITFNPDDRKRKNTKTKYNNMRQYKDQV